MINRYKNRRLFNNKSKTYEQVFKNRNVKHINHYSTPEFVLPSSADLSNIIINNHVWKEGDRYYKLAEQYYGDARDWWVIAKFNQLPTESHIQVGDIIRIPTPLNVVLQYMLG